MNLATPYPPTLPPGCLLSRGTLRPREYLRIYAYRYGSNLVTLMSGGENTFARGIHTCSLSLWRVVRGSKLMHLVSLIHGLFIT
jgi:hypothetical protein